MRHYMMAFVILVASQAHAGSVTGPVEYSPTDWFELVTPDSSASYSWSAAERAASGMTYNGIQGHLATVHSSDVNNFLKNEFSSYLSDDTPNGIYAWIGLYAPSPEANFQWVTGETINYWNWAPNEPNYFGQPFWQYVYYWTRDFDGNPTWSWDNTNNSPTFNDYGFIVEFGYQPTPEPSGFVMMSIGLILAVIYFRRR